MSEQSVKLGELTNEVGMRDAIHIAVASVVAGQRLEPGQHVWVHFDKEEPTAMSTDARQKNIGIIDPFLTAPVKKGQRCVLLLYPNTITSLRHYWTHPAFFAQERAANADERQESEQWLRNFAEQYSIDYAVLLQGVLDGEVCFGDDDGPYAARSDLDFWRHVQNVTNTKFSGERREGVVFRWGC